MSGGLFRTDGGARGSSGLDVSDPEIGKAWERVRQGEEEWMLLEYEGKSKLKVKATGTGDLPLSDEEIVFGGLRSQTGKFFCLMCTGEHANGLAKGRAAAHKNAAFNALDGTVGEVCGLSVEEFTSKLKELKELEPR
ncbi:unnamed protein product [Durusdinium trenchii]|uniref:ADF-H domain-containing protein n=2 Tax=Durusdinium trenchii TaxID=1381693 RepID=A0ABP0R727_9DINO